MFCFFFCIYQSDHSVGSLKQEVKTVLSELEDMQKRKTERRNQFLAVLEEINKITNQIRGEGGEHVPIDESGLSKESGLSMTKLKELQVQLQALEKEKLIFDLKVVAHSYVGKIQSRLLELMMTQCTPHRKENYAHMYHCFTKCFTEQGIDRYMKTQPHFKKNPPSPEAIRAFYDAIILSPTTAEDKVAGQAYHQYAKLLEEEADKKKSIEPTEEEIKTIEDMLASASVLSTSGRERESSTRGRRKSSTRGRKYR